MTTAFFSVYSVVEPSKARQTESAPESLAVFLCPNFGLWNAILVTLGATFDVVSKLHNPPFILKGGFYFIFWSLKTMSNTTAVTPETLPAIMWQNQPVITTELLADIYGAKAIQIQQNFKNNASRFIEGVHFFKLVGVELKAFKNRLDNIESVVGKNANALMLWTERGTVRHAKILDTDNAWAVQDRLEDFYFTKNQPKRNALIELPTISKSQIGEIACRVDEIVLASSDGAKVKPAIWSRFRTHFRINGYKELKADRYDEALDYLEKLRDEYANGVKMVLIAESELETLRSLPPIPDGMGLFSTKWIRKLEQKALPLQFKDFVHIAEQNGCKILLPIEVKTLKGIFKA